METRRLRETTQDQVDALHTPCVVIDYDDQPANVDEAFRADILEVLQVKKHPHGLVALRNIGNGPASKVQCSFEPDSKAGQYTRQGVAGIVPAAASVPIMTSYNDIVQYEFQFPAAYFSVSGQKYQTRGTVEKGILKNVSIQPLR